MESTERKLLDAAIDGDTDSLARLFAQYRGRLKRMVRLRMDPRLNGRVDSSDVLQDTFLDVSRRFNEFPAAGVSFIVWLRRLAAQKIVDL